MATEIVPDDSAKNCIFCQIIAGKVKSRTVYDDPEVLGILDINPAAAGHVLLLPKKHYVIMPQVPEAELGHLLVVAKQLSGALLRGLKVQGTTVFVANGAVAGQRAPHFMVHIIPRRDKDGLPLNLPKNAISESDLQRIRLALLPKLREAFSLSEDDVKRLGYGAEKQPEQEKQAEQQPEAEPPPEPSPAVRVKTDVDFDAIEAYFKKDGMQNLRAPQAHKK